MTISDAIRLLDADAWALAVSLGDRPSDAQMVAAGFSADLANAFEARVARWGEIAGQVRAALTESEAAAIEADFKLIEARIDECAQRLQSTEAEGVLPDPAHLRTTELWFYAADYLDMMVVARMNAARARLSGLKAWATP